MLVIFTFPETSYKRQVTADATHHVEAVEDSPKVSETKVEENVAPVPQRQSYTQSLRIFTTTYTDESLFKLAVRPIFALALPAVFWATLISSVTIGMIVVISANFSTAFSAIYGFETWQSGLTFIASIIGSLVAIFVGGHFTDFIADKLTLRNGGIRTPEMRLPALLVSLISSPLACILYGIGCGKKLHWICAVFGIGLGKKFILLLKSVRTLNTKGRPNSELYHSPINEYCHCVYSGFISSNWWRGYCYSIRFQRFASSRTMIPPPLFFFLVRMEPVS